MARSLRASPSPRASSSTCHVRFDTDALDVTLDLERLGSITSIPLLELRR